MVQFYADCGSVKLIHVYPSLKLTQLIPIVTMEIEAKKKDCVRKPIQTPEMN